MDTEKLTSGVSTVFTKLTGWVDQIFSIFGTYSAKYSKWIVIGVLVLIASKMFKFKVNVGGGRGR